MEKYNYIKEIISSELIILKFVEQKSHGRLMCPDKAQSGVKVWDKIVGTQKLNELSIHPGVIENGETIANIRGTICAWLVSLIGYLVFDINCHSSISWQIFTEQRVFTPLCLLIEPQLMLLQKVF